MAKTDHYLLIIIALIIFLGILSLYSVSLPLSLKITKEKNYFFWHQILYGYLPGFFLFLIFLNIKLSFLKKISYFLFLGTVILNLLVFVPFFAKRGGGATRWVKIDQNFSFQPFEISKPLILLFFANYLSEPNINKKKEFLRLLKVSFFLFIFILVLFFQSNLSNIIVLSGCFLILFLINQKSIKYFLFLVFLCLLIIVVAALTSPYRQNRILTFLRPEKDLLGGGFQINQVLMAIGSGKVLGEGFGMSDYKFFDLLPKMIFDAPFAIFAQETGFIGSSFLLFLFLIFFIRCVKISKEMKDSFKKSIVWAIGSWIVLQFLFNVGSMLHLLPVAGIPLPFFSYGGSAIIGQMIGLGLLLNASKKDQN